MADDGTGNYKGVMLCNRPSEPIGNMSRLGPALAGPEKPSFRPSGIGGEPIGLNPAKENLMTNMMAVKEEFVRRRHEDAGRYGRPPNFLNKHRAWLAEMAAKKAKLNEELAVRARARARRRPLERR